MRDLTGDWLPYESFPTGYRHGSDIVEESRCTLAVLTEILAFARMRPKLQQAERSPLRFVSPTPGVVCDCPELDEILAELKHLEVVPDDETRKGPSKDFVAIRVINRVTSVLRGYIEHVRTIPLRCDPQLVLYIRISDVLETLTRDNHGVGWHYHYCDRNGRRSDTMLSFDTNQPLRIENGQIVPLLENAPLFWERHSESKAKFEARAERWGNEKRESVFKAARPDLKKQKPVEFRRPANGANPVWPKDAVLSSRASYLR
jgi:hypothetical protein